MWKITKQRNSQQRELQIKFWKSRIKIQELILKKKLAQLVQSIPIVSEVVGGSNLPIASGQAIIAHKKLQQKCWSFFYAFLLQKNMNSN